MIKNTPATTKVEEWIRAEAGVGASIASGSQTWEKNWAALIPPEVTKQNENNVKKWKAKLPINKKWKAINGVCKNIIDKSVVLKTEIAKIKARNINMSLILENTKVLSEALIV